jgi:RNA polymerase sigma-70 factor, ECF subfamily
MTVSAELFETHRDYLTGLAYRMLGAFSDAQDVVQDAYLRWHGLDSSEIENPRGYLAKVVTRLCIDRLRSARTRREAYVGPWLPEPLIDASGLELRPSDDLAEDISVAFLLALERLSPLERAAFLLHDIFDMDFAEIAPILARSEPSCRQLASRARMHVKEARPRFAVNRERGAELAEAFLTAVSKGDLSSLTALLAEDAVLQSDGGGKLPAALYPIRGRDKIARFFIGIARKADAYRDLKVRPGRINGLPGFILVQSDGTVQTVAFETDAKEIRAIYAIRNPDKLAHIALQ